MTKAAKLARRYMVNLMLRMNMMSNCAEKMIKFSLEGMNQTDVDSKKKKKAGDEIEDYQLYKEKVEKALAC